MAHCQQMVTDQTVFPTKYEQKFSDEFSRTISKMLRLIWHVICKLYPKDLKTSFLKIDLAILLEQNYFHSILSSETVENYIIYE